MIFHYLIDKLGSTRVDSTENILKKGDNYLHENIFFLRKSVYPEDKEWKKRYLEYQTNKLNNDPDYVLRDQRYLMCCEVLYTKQELNTYKIQYFENALWSERKIKTLIPGDTLIVALKKMTETNELKHRLMTLIEVPNSMTYVPFEDCTSYVQIHGDTCYGQITEPYSLGEPEKYPYIYEEMPVEEIFRLIKSIHPISEKVTITDD